MPVVARAPGVSATVLVLARMLMVLVMALAGTGISELAVAVLTAGGAAERPTRRSAAGDRDRAAGPAKAHDRPGKDLNGGAS